RLVEQPIEEPFVLGVLFELPFAGLHDLSDKEPPIFLRNRTGTDGVDGATGLQRVCAAARLERKSPQLNVPGLRSTWAVIPERSGAVNPSAAWVLWHFAAFPAGWQARAVEGPV